MSIEPIDMPDDFYDLPEIKFELNIEYRFNVRRITKANGMYGEFYRVVLYSNGKLWRSNFTNLMYKLMISASQHESLEDCIFQYMRYISRFEKIYHSFEDIGKHYDKPNV